MDSQDPLDSLIPPPNVSEPTTPELSHTTIPESTAAAVSKVQSSRIENAPRNMTPPPSTQVPSSSRPKTRTPTPPISHISTPPPTVELSADSQRSRLASGLVGTMSVTELEAASPEELRLKVTELQAAFQEAKMSAAHHKLQYQMLSQESAAAIERMAVEAKMAQFENEVIHHAEQARAAATPQPSPAQEGMIPVQKDLYQRMCREIQLLREANNDLHTESEARQATINRQEDQIASLSDKVILMRERIYENRERLHKHRRPQMQHQVESTPRSVYSPAQHRSHPNSQQQSQPFAALLQASEMVSQESARSAPRGIHGKKGHVRNMHSTSSLPSTPQRIQKVQYETPSMNRHQPLKVPSTAPVPRTSAMRTPDVYAQSLPVSQGSQKAGPPSDGTVSASDHDNDSEAETDIIEQDDEINVSQASRAASQMLRSSHEQQAKRDSFKGNGMLQPKTMKQTKLFGAVRKANVDRSEEPPAKRARTNSSAVGLGIAGVGRQ
ncbi:hypothetical protein PRZ48_014976 [Zasmidium cellare]|uniref:FAD-dependent oxidoreductase-like enzyme n=1 Tax=Zasmidium cellare TaxID=395010 RepID=A0ABR0DXQ0_ZASCE|nr:hypothetical protein PRZ48_014976 [Zasmidium cellare]